MQPHCGREEVWDHLNRVPESAGTAPPRPRAADLGCTWRAAEVTAAAYRPTAQPGQPPRPVPPSVRWFCVLHSGLSPGPLFPAAPPGGHHGPTDPTVRPA